MPDQTFQPGSIRRPWKQYFSRSFSPGDNQPSQSSPMIIDFHDFSHQPPLPVMFLRSNEYHSFRHDNLGFRGLTYLIPVFSVNSDRSQSEPICRIFYPAKDVIQAFCFPCIFLQSDNCQTPVIGYVINKTHLFSIFIYDSGFILSIEWNGKSKITNNLSFRQ